MSDYILPMCITKNYVTTSLKNRIKEVFGLFEYLKLVDNEIELPKITAN